MEREVVEYEWFGKKMEEGRWRREDGGGKMEKEGRWTNKYKNCHPESRGDGGQPFLLPNKLPVNKNENHRTDYRI